MTITIIFGIGILIGLLFYKKTNPNLLKLILIGLTASFISGLFFKNTMISGIGFGLFGFLSFVFGIYCLKEKLWLNSIIGFFSGIAIFHGIMHWPYYGIIQLAMLVPIVCYIIICSKWKNHLNEFSISTILTFYSFTKLFELIKNWI